jgi:hypothetical protein
VVWDDGWFFGGRVIVGSGLDCKPRSYCIELRRKNGDLALLFFTCPSIHVCRPKKTPLWFVGFDPAARPGKPRDGDTRYAFSSPNANCIKVSIDAR